VPLGLRWSPSTGRLTVLESFAGLWWTFFGLFFFSRELWKKWIFLSPFPGGPGAESVPGRIFTDFSLFPWFIFPFWGGLGFPLGRSPNFFFSFYFSFPPPFTGLLLSIIIVLDFLKKTESASSFLCPKDFVPSSFPGQSQKTHGAQ